MLIYADPRCLEHDVPTRHPERADRLRAILSYFDAQGLLASSTVRQPLPADHAALRTIHDETYLDELQRSRPASGLVRLDPDTAMGPGSLDAAALAAGAVADAVRAVLSGEDKRAFCAVRPPGHHAERGAAMGFCIYGNAALGAVTALADPAIERVAILDFDVHHGNGTVEMFQDDPRVLVCSSFQHPFYPHRYYDLVRPNIVNTPLPSGTGSAKFRAAIERDWLPALERHMPDLVIVSAGFDAHRADPMAELELGEDDYRWVTRLIVDAANSYAKGRVISTLEGGYDLAALARSAAEHVVALAES
jgi:acetoin utilization deacetylase AcuC-like enzyme